MGGRSGETVGIALGAASGDAVGRGAVDALAGAGLGACATQMMDSKIVTIIALRDLYGLQVDRKLLSIRRGLRRVRNFYMTGQVGRSDTARRAESERDSRN
jgi:hypothetical protein